MHQLNTAGIVYICRYLQFTWSNRSATVINPVVIVGLNAHLNVYYFLV